MDGPVAPPEIWSQFALISMKRQRERVSHHHLCLVGRAHDKPHVYYCDSVHCAKKFYRADSCPGCVADACAEHEERLVAAQAQSEVRHALHAVRAMRSALARNGR